jgi:hypothetical protein
MITGLRFLLTSIALVLAAAPVPASGQTADEDEKTELSMTWAPPAPAPKDWDWIMLVSGEWLKGDIIVLHEDQLEFESDELDTLNLDWEDVARVRSPRQNSLRFEGKVIVKGTILIKDGIVKVGTEEGEKVFDRARLLTIIPGEPTEANYWDGKFSVGITARSGNTDQTESQFLLNVKRRTLASRFVMDYVGNYGELEQVQNVNNHRVDAKFDFFVTRTFYMTPLSVEFYKDPFQNIRLQSTPATGVGFHILDQGDLKWDVEPAIGYRYTRYDSVEADEDRTSTTFALIGRTFFEMDITKDLDFSLNYSLSMGLNSPRNNIHHTVIQSSFEVSDTLDLNIAFTWDQQSNPQADSDGTVPEKNDFRLTLGIALEF